MVTGLAVEAMGILLFFRQLKSDYSGRDCNDGITDQHYEGGNKFSQYRCWDNISVSNRGDRDDCPIDSLGDTTESTFFTLNDIHDCSENYHDDQDEQ